VRLPAPTSVAQSDPGVHLGPLLLLPRPAAKPAIAGADKKPGTGEAGAPNQLTLSKEITGALPPRVERPTATPGRTEAVASPTPIAVPRIAPPRASDEPDPAAAKPKIALLLVPPLQSSYVPLPPGPAPSAAAPPAPAAPKPQESPVTAAPPAPPAPPTSAGRPAPTPNPPTAIGDGRRPGPTTPAADPAQPSDSESDPFARIGSANLLRDGKLEVQFGRKVKTVRPKVPLVGQIDAFAMVNPSVTLKVNIDPTGKVTHAMIHKSSGSNEIDQPCLIAMYEWWFEPLKDKSGRPIPDSLLFTISFR
jgi:TonB family protein